MAGKACVLTSRRLAYALDHLSKNALIELIVDRARAQIGLESSDEELATEINQWLAPVARERDDRPINLVALIARLDRNDEDYRNKTGKFTQATGFEE
jgi:hypothetical protein